MVTKALMMSVFFLAQQPFVDVLPRGVVDLDYCRAEQARIAQAAKPTLPTVGGRTTTKEVIHCELVDGDVIDGWKEQYDEPGSSLPR